LYIGDIKTFLYHITKRVWLEAVIFQLPTCVILSHTFIIPETQSNAVLTLVTTSTRSANFNPLVRQNKSCCLLFSSRLLLLSRLWCQERYPTIAKVAACLQTFCLIFTFGLRVNDKFLNCRSQLFFCTCRRLQC